MTNLVRSRQQFEVTLTRKTTISAEQSARKRIEHVKAEDAKQAGEIALSMPHNKAFKVSSVREIR